VIAWSLFERRLGRRAVIAGALGGTAGMLGGCATQDGPTGTRPRTTTSPFDSGSSDQTAGDSTVSGWVPPALSLIARHRQLVEEIGAQYPRFGRQFRSLLESHDAHEAFLRGVLGETPSAAPGAKDTVPRNRAAVEKAVQSSTIGAARMLRAQSNEAADGSGARALASMAAAISQQVTALGWSEPQLDVDLSRAPAASAEELSALQRVLAREHASLWWYGVLGGQTSAARQPQLFAAVNDGYLAHRQNRDQLETRIRLLDEIPVASDAAYPIRWVLGSPRGVFGAARDIEHDSAATYSWLVSQTRGGAREWAAVALRNAAIRELAVQGTPENFPGADELADR
jgi:Domain of unknown function (DUF4439)